VTDEAPASPAAALTSLVARAVDADPTELGGAVEVVGRGADADGTPADRLADLLAGGDSVVAVVPRFDAALARRLDASLASTEPRAVRVVLTGSAGERLSGPTGAVVRRALADRGVDAYRHDGDSPLLVALAGERAAVGSADADGFAALLTTEAPAVREWAAATCARYLDAAEPLGEG
jgi:hypothetical protein